MVDGECLCGDGWVCLRCGWERKAREVGSVASALEKVKRFLIQSSHPLTIDCFWSLASVYDDCSTSFAIGLACILYC